MWCPGRPEVMFSRMSTLDSTWGRLQWMLATHLLVVTSMVAGCRGERPAAAASTSTDTSTRAPAAATTGGGAAGATAFTADVVHQYPHDPTAYTQGLELEGGDTLFEGTGLEGQSSVRSSLLSAGTTLHRAELEPKYFGEGITVFHGKLYQLTWRSRIGFIYDAATLRRVGSFKYDGEGWGLTHDSASLIMSDGTNVLRFLDPRTLAVQHTLGVTDGGRPVERLNELEWMRGEILANIWQTNQIARIDPGTGQVRGWIDLTALRPPSLYADTTDVLNGIAYDSTHDRLFVTGKLWPTLFEIRLRPQS